MRVQIYQEELGEDVELVKQTSRNGEQFFGLRIWLKTCQELLEHSTPEDDDRSAVTFWASSQEALQRLVNEMRHRVFGGIPA
ncbi:MAG TPA: hypothetical protein VGR70_09870 [Stellaceae bacterium]|nr:hypothetical protein [Stellaceae bacterium]